MIRETAGMIKQAAICDWCERECANVVGAVMSGWAGDKGWAFVSVSIEGGPDDPGRWTTDRFDACPSCVSKLMPKGQNKGFQ